MFRQAAQACLERFQGYKTAKDVIARLHGQKKAREYPLLQIFPRLSLLSSPIVRLCCHVARQALLQVAFVERGCLPIIPAESSDFSRGVQFSKRNIRFLIILFFFSCVNNINICHVYLQHRHLRSIIIICFYCP